MSIPAFYEQGLHFSCTRCSACCRYDPGFVFLSEKDLARLVTALGMSYSELIATYCRWIPVGNGTEQLSLKERSNYDCIFWKEGCTVYEGRPLQCRSFPFWESIVASPETWDAAKADCPGIGKGAFHDAREIEKTLALRKAEPIVQRSQP